MANPLSLSTSTTSSSSLPSMASPPYRSLYYVMPDASFCKVVCDIYCRRYDLCSSPPPSPFSSPAAAAAAAADPVSTSIRFHHHSAILPALPAAAGSFLAGALLLLVVVLFLVRRRRRRERASATRVVDADGDLFLGGGGHEVDHHVWYIRTVGLDESTIGAITAWAYKSGEDSVLGGSAADCAVCLGEFRDGELLRLLSKCGHAFHQPCIDTWLRSHVNCPLCRAPVVAPNSSASAAISSGESPGNIGSSPSSSSSRLPPPAAREPANLRLPDRGNSSLQSISGGSDQEVDCKRLGFELRDAMLINLARCSELGSSSGGLKMIRRSPSMDSLPLSAFVFRLDPEEQSSEEGTTVPDFGEGQVRKNRGEQGHASKRGSFLKGTERSFSSVSRRFSLSRIGRSTSSILPL